MGNIDDGEKKKRKKEKIGENSRPITSLSVNHLNGDRLQRQSSCQFSTSFDPWSKLRYDWKFDKLSIFFYYNYFRGI